MKTVYRNAGRSVACAVIAVTLSGCIAFPPIAPKPVGNEHYLTCSQLDNSFDEAQGFMRRAEEEDKFRLSYLFPPSGMLSVWNIVRAKSRATDRMTYIQQVKQQKNCPQAGVVSDGGYPQQQPQGGGYPAMPAQGGYGSAVPGQQYYPQGQGGGYGYPQQQGGYGMPQGYGYPR